MGSPLGRIGFAVGGALLGGWLLAPAFGIFGTTIGMLAGSYLGSLIFPADYESKMPSIADYPVQSSSVGTPLPVVLGKARLSGNVIWASRPLAMQIKHSTGGGGKGGGGDEQVYYETSYKRSFLIAICEGPATILRAWENKKSIPTTKSRGTHWGWGWFGDPSLYCYSGFDAFDGNDNTGISGLIGKNYADYSNVCLAYFESYNLGNSPVISNFVFEVSSFPISSLAFAGGSQTSLTLVDAFLNKKGDYTIPDGGKLMDVAYQSAGTILAIGDDGYLYSFYSNGTLNTSWGEAGRVFVHETCHGVLVHSDSSIFVTHACLASDDSSMSKYTAEGELVWRKKFVKESHHQYKMVEYEEDIIATCTSEWPHASYGIAVRIDVDGTVLNRYKDVQCEGGVGWDVAVDENGNVYVAHGFALSKFSLGGTWIGNNYKSGGAYPHPVYGVDTISVDGATKIYIASEPWNSKSVFRMKYSLDIEKSYNIGNVSAWCVRIYQENVFVGSEYSEELDSNMFRFDLDLNLDCSSGTGDESSIYDIAMRPAGASGEVDEDMNFASMIESLLTNKKYGGYENDDLIAEDFNDAIVYCESNNLKGSLVIKEQKPLTDWIAYICSHFQGYFYEIGGKIGLNCYREQPSVLSITQDDLIREGDEPPMHITKRKYSETFNRLEVAWTNRSNNYKEAVVSAFDKIDQREAGQVRTKIMDLRAITDAELASKMAWRIFIDQIYRFSQYTFKLGYKSMLLEVGDVIDVTDGHLLTAQKMRVMSVSEEKDGRTALITAVEDVSDLYPDADVLIQQSEASSDEEITLEDGTIFFREDCNDNKLYLSIVPGGEQCTGFYVYLSYDDETYNFIGKLAIGGITSGEANSTGTIQSGLPAHTTVIHCKDEAFDVDIGTVTDLDTAITDDDFFNSRKLIRVGDEIITYRDCVESDTEGIWRVSNLIRGLFGTKPVAHASGESFCTLNVDFIYTPKESDIGETLYFKVVSFYADEVQNVSDVSSQSHVMSGKHLKPMPVSLMRINGREGLSTYETADVTIDWYFCSKTSGFGRGGYGNALWGTYTKDPLLSQLRVKLEEEDGTDITGVDFELDDYGESPQLEILEADREGKNPVRVKLTPGSNLWCDETRNILIEKI